MTTKTERVSKEFSTMRAPSRNGMAKKTSVIRESSESIQPPK